MHETFKPSPCSAALLFVFIVGNVLSSDSESLHNIETVDGRNVTIECKISRTSKPSVKWTKDNAEIKNENYSILTNGNLLISEVNITDAGNYTCTDSNSNATAKSILTVKERTQIAFEQDVYKTVVGSDAELRCTATVDRSLHANIDWFAKDKLVHFETDDRSWRTGDLSMTINKTAESDSGVYRCVARTELDQATASAQLIVYNKPDPPRLSEIACRKRDATVQWRPNGDGGAPIWRYTVEYNTSYAPDTWLVASDTVPASDLTYTARMTPWANYTFRVIASNNFSVSNPSAHSDVCSTEPDVPFKNPENIRAAGTEPSNIVISWTPMPKIDLNGPGFGYRVYWKQDIPGQRWSVEEVADPDKKELIIKDQPAYRPYKIKVIAFNGRGESNAPQKEVVGYSGEDVPLEAPQNFTVLKNITENMSVPLAWKPVSIESVRGFFKGYIIILWIVKNKENSLVAVKVDPDKTTTEITGLEYKSEYKLRICAHNNRFIGPCSEMLSFETPEKDPLIRKTEKMVTSRWIIAMFLALLFTINLLVVAYIARRNRGVKRFAEEPEASHCIRNNPDESYFNECSQPLRSQKQCPESDTDSVAEYGEGYSGQGGIATATLVEMSQFTDDGQFTDQYDTD